MERDFTFYPLESLTVSNGSNRDDQAIFPIGIDPGRQIEPITTSQSQLFSSSFSAFSQNYNTFQDSELSQYDRQALSQKNELDAGIKDLQERVEAGRLLSPRSYLLKYAPSKLQERNGVYGVSEKIGLNADASTATKENEIPSEERLDAYEGKTVQNVLEVETKEPKNVEPNWLSKKNLHRYKMLGKLNSHVSSMDTQRILSVLLRIEKLSRSKVFDDIKCKGSTSLILEAFTKTRKKMKKKRRQVKALHKLLAEETVNTLREAARLPENSSNTTSSTTKRDCECLCFCRERDNDTFGPTQARRLCSSILPTLQSERLMELKSLGNGLKSFLT